MDRKRLFTLLLSFWCIGAFSQAHELVSASGASFQNSSGYISYSIGEVINLLILQIGDPLDFDYLLYDVRGGLIERGQVLNERTEINFSALAPAIYILRVTNHKEEVRLFQIVKY